MSSHPGRETLERWRADRPTNAYTSNPNLERTLAVLIGESATAAMRPRLEGFGAEVAGPLAAAAAVIDLPENGPRLRRYSEIGEDIEAIDFHPDYAAAGRRVWNSEIIALQSEPGRAMEQGALIYLLCHNGEAGHACPVACTAGLVRALQQHGSEALRERFLPPLLDPNWDEADLGAQFLTEIQGGSDVGANIVRAEADAEVEGAYRIYGEKWFCSVANADQFLMTARLPGAGGGTGGLGTFLVPRRTDDGAINGFSIRRLKTKLGTRAMASGEIDFDGALAWPVGDLREGFSVAVGVLNTSRWVNALGSTGIMRGALTAALGFARHREAFGGSISRFPLVRATLARMKTEEAAALSSTLYLSRLIDRLDTGKASEHERSLYRLLVNANKFVTSEAATIVTRGALEVFGGNGAIEDFSPVPRLLRDNFVFETWEGTHNVLSMQVLRDCGRFGLFANLMDEVRTSVETLEDEALRAEVPALEEATARLSDRVAHSLTDGRYGAAHFRAQMHDFMRLFQTSRLLVEAEAETKLGVETNKAAMAGLLLRDHLVPGYRPDDDENFGARVDAALGDDLPLPT